MDFGSSNIFIELTLNSDKRRTSIFLCYLILKNLNFDDLCCCWIFVTIEIKSDEKNEKTVKINNQLAARYESMHKILK